MKSQLATLVLLSAAFGAMAQTPVSPGANETQAGADHGCV